MVFAFFAVYCMVEYKTLPTFVHSSFQPVTALQLRVTAGFVLFFFAFSNLSYLQLDLPFTDEAPKGIFNARTLIDMAGVFALLGLNLSRMEMISVQENIILREAMERQYHQYTAAQEARELINHKYHDLKHHLVVLRRNGENTAELLDAVEKGLDAYETAFDTGNKVLDTILTDKGDLCREKQIEFTVIADGTLLQPVSVADLCTMFGNALDNAIEYEEKVPEVGKRRIALTIRRWNAFVSVVFENYFEGSLAVGDSLPQTTKQEKEYHGYGLSSIKRTAERYGGTMVVSQEDHYFRLKLLLPLGE
ncbi:MAG: sensor histidine kinase [Oscillospiraceae bacterium]|nr:sensor histidine kinase [Oscillospiraceae bacterium]